MVFIFRKSNLGAWGFVLLAPLARAGSVPAFQPFVAKTVNLVSNTFPQVFPDPTNNLPQYVRPPGEPETEPRPFSLSTGTATHEQDGLIPAPREALLNSDEWAAMQAAHAGPGIAALIRAAELGTTSRRSDGREILGSKPADLSTHHCYMHVKLALQIAGCIPDTGVLPSGYAKNAVGDMRGHPQFFTEIKMPDSRDPSDVPAGAIIVYKGDPAGHIEIKTFDKKYVSDFIHAGTCRMPMIGVFMPHCDGAKK